LPLCSYSKIIPASQRILPADGRQYLEATLTVGLPPFLQETYDSAVYINHDEYTIETHSIKSQKFDSLKSYWKLSSSSSGENVVPPNLSNADAHSPLPHYSQPPPLSALSSSSPAAASPAAAAAAAAQTTTHVYFMVEMTVSDPVIATTLDQLLVKVAKQQVEAFAQRCQTIE
jgi:ribosome-associated toxin RatA of RatAB toxin-antitoxin module